MADKIRGITIEIGGDTTGLSKALKNIDSEVRTTQRELKDVQRLLKLDPGNTELLRQKQQLLGKEVEQTKKKLDDLNQLQANMDASGIDRSSDQYMALQREIIATTNELDRLTSEASESNAAFAKVGATLDDISNKAGIAAEKTAGISKAAAGALGAIGALGVKAVKEFADYEQLVGGVDTLFKQASKEVQDFANQAYKTAGMSANDYMETVTSFSASLIQSLGGNTFEAAHIADMAIIDMSDNANKMGTDMASIQNAYQGFAKQNYNMLDNLKLGYGGTKAEMERLLADAEKLSGIHYDIGNLSDVYNAIHVIQQELGITGTTAKEAESTISGSINTLKAALSNLAAGFGQTNADINMLAQNVIEAAKNVAANLLAVIQAIWENLPTPAKIGIIVVGILAVLSPLLSMISTTTSAISSIIPILSSIFSAVVANPIILVIAAISAAIIGLVYLIISNWETISAWMDSVAQFFSEKFTQIKESFLSALDTISNAVVAVGSFLVTVFKTIVNGIITMVENAINRLISGINSIISAFNRVVSAVASIIGATYSGISQIQSIRLPRMAKGGFLSSGTAMVGEAGPELLTMVGNRAMVTPLTSGGNETAVNPISGGTSVDVNVEFSGSLAQLARILQPAITAETVRRGGSLIKT